MPARASFFRKASFSRKLLPVKAHSSRSERVISGWSFPVHIWGKVAVTFPQVSGEIVRAQVDQGLRDWFICCAWRGKRELGMPSRIVDEAWHELILDSTAYVAFCRATFGSYLHHTPEGKPRIAGPPPLVNTIWAWDRSRAGRSGDECALWDLDRRLAVDRAWGVSETELDLARRSDYTVDGGFERSGGGTTTSIAMVGGACGAAGGCGTGGDSAGGGCGTGGGCSGGGSG